MALDLEAAWQIIEKNLPQGKVDLSPVLSNQLGMVLAEDIRADMDMPPFVRAMMDGFAIRPRVEKPEEGLQVVGMAEAGSVPGGTLDQGQAWEIATGAPVPENTFAVLPKEIARLECREGFGKIVFPLAQLPGGKNLFPAGGEFKTGQLLLPAGTSLGPAEYGILAQAGKTAVRLFQSPRTAILSTGNELVDPNQKPGPGKIRNSNGPMLMGQAARAGAIPRFLGIAQDCPKATESLIREGLGHQVLILSGGVSVGPKDFVRPALESLGVEIHVHGVHLKPGKPFLFGRHPGGTVVFGLPGNPVSSYVTFELLVRPALERLRGLSFAGLPKPVKAKLANAWQVKTDRPLRQPARIFFQEDTYQLEVREWKGSPDILSLSGANALACAEPGNHQFQAGDTIAAIPIP